MQDRQINPDSFYDDSDEVMIACDRCGKEHSIHNSNEVSVWVRLDCVDEQWCNECKNEWDNN